MKKYVRVSDPWNREIQSDLDVRICKAVYSAIEQNFDIDFGFLGRSYWYEIRAREINGTIEPYNRNELEKKVFAALKPIFKAAGFTRPDHAVGQEFFMNLDKWLHVEAMDPLTFDCTGAPVFYTEEERDRDKGRNWETRTEQWPADPIAAGLDPF